MTDPSDRFLRDLESRLHALGQGVDVPVVQAGDDVRRGRRRLFRVRVAMGGATTATLAVVLGITSLTAGSPKATDAPQMTQPPTSLTATPSSTPSPGADDASGRGGKHGGKGSDAGLGGAAVGPGSDASTGTTDPDGPPTGTPVKDGSASGATPPGSAPPHHQPDADDTGGATDEPTEDPSGTPTSTPTGTPTTDPTGTPTTDPTGQPTEPPTGSTRVRVHQVLNFYNDVLAEHLDADRSHLQPYNRFVDSRTVRTEDGLVYVFGGDYRWGAGDDAADLDVSVVSGWDQVGWECGTTGTDWQCHAGPTGAVEVARHDGLLEVAAEHASGQVVVVSTDVSLAEGDLAAAAADERLVLPGSPAVAPPRLDPSTFSDAGLDLFVVDGETFTQTAADRSPWVRGQWTGTRGGGLLAWTAAPIYSGGAFECSAAFRSCSEVVVDNAGTTVHLGYLTAKAGGGWVVQYDGPAYAVRVTSTAKAFPRKRAYAFVTRPAWQPVP